MHRRGELLLQVRERAMLPYRLLSASQATLRLLPSHKCRNRKEERRCSAAFSFTEYASYMPFPKCHERMSMSHTAVSSYCIIHSFPSFLFFIAPSRSDETFSFSFLSFLLFRSFFFSSLIESFSFSLDIFVFFHTRKCHIEGRTRFLHAVYMLFSHSHCHCLTNTYTQKTHMFSLQPFPLHCLLPPSLHDAYRFSTLSSLSHIFPPSVRHACLPHRICSELEIHIHRR